MWYKTPRRSLEDHHVTEWLLDGQLTAVIDKTGPDLWRDRSYGILFMQHTPDSAR
jgi:hypothetical protein